VRSTAGKVPILPDAAGTVFKSEGHFIVANRTCRERFAFQHGDIVLDAMTVMLDSVYP
jgi:hypothetical protein